MDPKIDAFLTEAETWREEMNKLRKIGLDCGLTEELKWGKPCYSLDGSNILIIQPFKEYCALMFCKGALLKDARRLLVRIGENTQAARQLRFKSVADITKIAATIKEYILEAIAAQKAGLEVKYKTTSEFAVPEEFKTKLAETSALKTAFAKLTPGRQRGYLLHFAAPKQSKTRTSRVEKWIPQILKGKGLND